MDKLIIYGNSGAGKSTLAKQLKEERHLVHMDLDTIAWVQGVNPPERMPLEESYNLINDFISKNDKWVIEGCYADLIAYVIPQSSEMIFLNPTSSYCVENAMERPWEPHKYESKEKQDEFLPNLINWIKEYSKRDGPLSLNSHLDLFSNYKGKKEMLGGVVISKSSVEDYKALLKLTQNTIRTVNRKDYTQEQVNVWAYEDVDFSKWEKSFEKKSIFVAKELNRYLGYCDLMPNGHIDRFFIASSRVGQGIGKELYCELEAEAKLKNMSLLTVDASITAKPFFESLGFVVKKDQIVQLRGMDFINYKMVKPL